jgi:hypothetical protein
MRACALQATGDTSTAPGTEIPLDRALETARDATPVLVTGALQELGWLDRLAEMFFAVIGSIAGPAAADRLRTDGLQHLHEHLAPDAVARLLTDLDARMRPLANSFAADIVTVTAPDLGRRYYIGQRVFVRAQVPYPMLTDYPELAQAGHLAGHLRPTGRHRDVDLTHPVGTVSLWAALGPVVEGNSIQVWVDDDAPPIVPTFAPGDLCLFQSDCWHASVENHTNETRVAVGVRVLASPHLRYGPGDHWRPYADARLVHTPLAALATARSRCTAAAFRRWRFRRRWERAQRAAGRAGTPSLKR